MLYISYISNTKALANILNCIEIHDSTNVSNGQETLYWAVDTSVVCYEGPHAVLAGAIGWPFLIIFVFGFPISTAVLILKNVKEDFTEGWIYDTAGFMYRSYGRRFIFWESIVMLRKAAVAVVVVFAYPLGTDLQVASCIVVLIFASYLHIVCRPFRKEFDILNELEGVSLLLSLLTFVSSLFIDGERVPWEAKITISVIVFLMDVGGFLFFVAVFLNFGSHYLRAELDREGISYIPERGAFHILTTYGLFQIKKARNGLYAYFHRDGQKEILEDSA